MKRISREDLVADIAQSLNCAIAQVPGDLTDVQLGKALGYATGTVPVKRARGDLPIPSFKAGKSRRTPLSAVIKFKLDQISEQVESLDSVGGQEA